MTAKEYLSQAYETEQHVEAGLRKIEALKYEMEDLNRRIAAEPAKHTKQMKEMHDTVHRIIEAEAEMNREIDQLADLKQEIRETIDQVRNMTYQLILEERHLSFMKWEQIGNDLGYTERWALLRYREALEAVQEIIDSRAA